MNPSVRRTLAATATVGVLAGTALTTALALPGSAESPGHPAGAQVAQLRKDVARYADVSAALADGFVPTAECAEHPQLGGMGMHYVHPARMQSAPDPRRPQLLLYGPGKDGEPQLLGAEFFVADGDQDLSTDDDRPSLWGRPFDGPMPGHEQGMPVHYDLHVWTDHANPTGVLSPWNPRVDC